MHILFNAVTNQNYPPVITGLFIYCAWHKQIRAEHACLSDDEAFGKQGDVSSALEGFRASE